MSSINKTDIKVKASQRLDDTDQGGGQMTSTTIVSGSINNLVPDISRIDRVYGNVTLRKEYVAVDTENRNTYFGAHVVLTEQAADSNVGVCFFSSEDWFDTRQDARNRIEAYLVQGPAFTAFLWGTHYRGTKNISMITDPAWPIPVIGDVLVFIGNAGLSTEFYQYVRITDISYEVRTFTYLNGSTASAYDKKVLAIKIGNSLEYDFVGNEVGVIHPAFSALQTKIYTTVAADASRYYGVSSLAENVNAGLLQFRVKNTHVPLVPSAQSETAITDAGVGTNIVQLLQTKTGATTITRSLTYNMTSGSKIFIGEAILPGTFSWTGGLTLTDDGAGNVYSNAVAVGSIDYTTGIVSMGATGSTASGTGTVTYMPAAPATDVSETGAIQIEIANRGFTYVYNCEPPPVKGTLKIDFLAGGKWYSIQDVGTGQLKGSDPSIGSGSVNFLTGSVSMTLGAMPDVDSKILLFWGKNANYSDLSGETLPLQYRGTTHNPGIVRNTFKVRWGTNQCIMDDGLGALVRATGSGDVWTATATVVGSIKYATGVYKFGVAAEHTVPLSSEQMRITYSYGDRRTETFNAPPRSGDGTIALNLSNAPLLPGTFEIEWHTFLEEYDSLSEARPNFRNVSTWWNDPTYTFQDDSAGHFKGDVNDGSGNWVQGTVNYTTGQVRFQPDRRGSFPNPLYEWVDSGIDIGNSSIFRWIFTGIEYVTAASIFPTEGTVVVTYADTEGANAADYLENLQKKFFIKETSVLGIVPGSLSFYAGIGASSATTYVTDPGNGTLYMDVVGTTGVGTVVGTVNYDERIVTITNDTVTARSLTISFCTGTAGGDPTQVIMFRTPGAPLRSGSVGVKATLSNGEIVVGTSDFDGNIVGDGVEGHVDFNAGIGIATFGVWEEDTYSALPPFDPSNIAGTQPNWYAGSPTDAGNVWHPYSVAVGSILINCVVTSYLPLDADLLGLDPVRLPLDGKVPIYRDGYILLIHNTKQETLPTIAVAGPLSPLSRTNLDLIELWDSRAEEAGGSQYWPDGGNYTVDLATGVITILPTFNITGFTQPFKAIHRQEDLVLASDVQITGYIAVTQPLKHSYTKDDSFVSSVLTMGNLQSRAYNEFDQSTWSGVWSDDVIGTVVSTANYNFVDYPITVINRTCTKERWLLLLKSSNTIDIIGENLGTLAAGVSIVTGNYNPIDGLWLGDPGFTGGYIAVRNRNFGNLPYWVMSCAGFGTGWQSNNGIRFNTDASNYPIWVVRTTLQGSATETTDNYVMQVRGDNA